MQKSNIIKYTKHVMRDLEAKDLYMTHLMIAYKVITYYENNIGKITDGIGTKLQEIIYSIYGGYLKNNDTDLLDEIIEETFINNKRL